MANLSGSSLVWGQSAKTRKNKEKQGLVGSQARVRAWTARGDDVTSWSWMG